MEALVTDWHGQRWVDLPGRLHALRRDGVLAFDRSPQSRRPRTS
jgi:tRNA(Ile)-lysidine synthase